VNWLSIQVFASNLRALSCSVAEDMMIKVTIRDSADILARCTSTTLAVGLRASISEIFRDGDGAEIGLWWDCVSGGPRHYDWAVDPVTASNLSEPK